MAQFFDLGEQLAPFLVSLAEPFPVDVLAACAEAGANLVGLLSDQARIEHKCGHSTSAF